MHSCLSCSKIFPSKYRLNRHTLTHAARKCRKCDESFDDINAFKLHTMNHFRERSETSFRCDLCLKTFVNKSNLKRHRKKCSEKGKKTDSACASASLMTNDFKIDGVSTEKNVKINDDEDGMIKDDGGEYLCETCDVKVKRKFQTSHTRSSDHIRKSLSQIDERCFVYKTALKNQLIIYRVVNVEKTEGADDFEMEINVDVFLRSIFSCVRGILEAQLREKKVIKFRLNIVGMYSNPSPGSKDEEMYEEGVKNFYTDFQTLSEGNDISEIYEDLIKVLVNLSDEFNEQSSGWTILRLLHLDVEICKITHLSTGSFIQLPKFIQSKNACINVKNMKDHKCFVYAVLAGMFHKFIPRSKRNDPDSYKLLEKNLVLKNIDFPITLREIRLFERLNTNISVNIYTIDNKEISGPLYITREEKKNHVNLLMLEDGDKTHFATILNLSSLLGVQISKNTRKIFFCFKCLNHFNRGVDLEFHHFVRCGEVKTIMPIEKPYLEFQNFKAKQRHPFTIVGDLESLLEVYQTCKPDPTTSYTTPTELHTVCSYGYSIKSEVFDKELDEVRLYRGRDCMDHFIDSLVVDVNLIYDRYLKNIHPMECITPLVRARLDKQKNCHFCSKAFAVNETPVLDHNHFTGFIRGYAHSSCNILCQTPKFLPIFFHNGSNYDYHPIIMALARRNVGELSVLPRTSENYISFSLMLEMEDGMSVELRFLDSFRFLSGSISSLTESMKEFPKFSEFHMKHFSSKNFCKDPQKQHLPYQYFSSFDVFEETDFPPIEAFYNSLGGSSITEEQYSHAVSVFNSLDDRTLGGYLDYYLFCDVCLLEDIIEHFRDTSLKNFGLDPVFFYTLAGFSFDAMLQHIDQKIYLIQDLNMSILLRNNIRGGIACSMLRFSESNNEYMPGGLDIKKPPNYIAYVDANGLYTYTMINFKLPIGEFEFLEGEAFEEISKSFMDVSETADFGYFLLVDVIYPEELHNLHNDLPLMPEKMRVGKVSKLVPNLYHKKDYCCHYLVLQQALRFGLKLKKIHKIIKFRQSFWLRSYISHCAELRKNPLNTSFQKKMLKEAANVVFGKCIQSVDKFRTVKLITEWASHGKRLDARRLLKDPRFKSFTIFNENFIAVEMQRRKVVYDRPTAVGFSILECSKVHMFNFVYGVLQPRLGADCLSIGYFDTDGLVLTSSKNFYKFMRENSEFFDTSDYPVDNQFNITPMNMKVPGLFKDECSGQIIKRFISLRPKSYAIEFMNGQTIKKLKSVSKSVTKSLQFNDYLRVLNNKETFYAKMFRIYSQNHVLETVEIYKKAMSGNDDKRHVLPNNINTLALGHKDILKN